MELIRSDELGPVAVLEMNAGKANAMSRAVVDRLDAVLGEAAASDARALVITGYDRFFSAGLDLPSLVVLDRAGMTDFIERFEAVMVRVFELPLPVVAAVNGHAVAGGCVLALQADVRLMAAGGGRIGLSEVQLGIGLPAVVVETLRLRVPPTSLRPIALEGRLLAADEAHQLGLVDEVVPGELLRARAVARARELAELPSQAFAQIKAALAAPWRERIADRAAETARWVDTWFSPAAQERVRAAVARLKK